MKCAIYPQISQISADSFSLFARRMSKSAESGHWLAYDEMTFVPGPERARCDSPGRRFGTPWAKPWLPQVFTNFTSSSPRKRNGV